MATLLRYLPLFLLAGFLLVVGGYNVRGYRAFTQLPVGVTTVIAGDSQTAHAFHTELTEAPDANLSRDGECIYFTTPKLISVLEKNEDITELWLSFSFHNILKSVEEVYLQDPVRALTYAERYGPLLSWKDLQSLNLSFHQKITLLAQYRLGLPLGQGGFPNPGDKKSGLIGGYNPTDDVMNLPVERANKKTYYDSLVSLPNTEFFSELFREHYVELFQLCQEKNIRVFLVQTPIHPEYKAFFPALFQEEFARWQADFAAQYGARIIDYSDFTVAPEEYDNLTHLNSQGSIPFTQHWESQRSVWDQMAPGNTWQYVSAESHEPLPLPTN